MAIGNHTESKYDLLISLLDRDYPEPVGWNQWTDSQRCDYLYQLLRLQYCLPEHRDEIDDMVHKMHNDRVAHRLSNPSWCYNL